MKKERLLKIWLETEPCENSPYVIYGCPPMWKTLEKEGMILFSRPQKTMTRGKFGGYVEIDGVGYQWKKDNKWIGQGISCTFEDFEKDLTAAK